MNPPSRKLRLVVSLSALILVLLHLLWPTLSIDTTTVFLLILGVIPWLAPLIKSVDLPGVGRVELQRESPALQEPSIVAARVAAEIRSQTAVVSAAPLRSRDSATTQNEAQERFDAGVRAGIRAVAKLLEDLSVGVRVDGHEDRRNIGLDLSRRLNAVADIMEPAHPKS